MSGRDLVDQGVLDELQFIAAGVDDGGESAAPGLELGLATEAKSRGLETLVGVVDVIDGEGDSGEPADESKVIRWCVFRNGLDDDVGGVGVEHRVRAAWVHGGRRSEERGVKADGGAQFTDEDACGGQPHVAMMTCAIGFGR